MDKELEEIRMELDRLALKMQHESQVRRVIHRLSRREGRGENGY
jgi:hypothetical protein